MMNKRKKSQISTNDQFEEKDFKKPSKRLRIDPSTKPPGSHRTQTWQSLEEEHSTPSKTNSTMLSTISSKHKAKTTQTSSVNFQDQPTLAKSKTTSVTNVNEVQEMLSAPVSTTIQVSISIGELESIGQTSRNITRIVSMIGAIEKFARTIGGEVIKTAIEWGEVEDTGNSTGEEEEEHGQTDEETFLRPFKPTTQPLHYDEAEFEQWEFDQDNDPNSDEQETDEQNSDLDQEEGIKVIDLGDEDTQEDPSGDNARDDKY